MLNEELETIEIAAIAVSAKPGMTYRVACREGAILAIREGVTVRVSHGAKVYVADPVALMNTVCKEESGHDD